MLRAAYDIRSLPKRYEQLLEVLPPRPIHTESDYREALEMVELMAGHKLTRDQQDYLSALGTFVANYEDEHDPVSQGSPIDALRLLMEERGMNTSDLGRVLGNRSVGSLILGGRRELSKSHIRTLADYFGVSPAVFI